MKWILDSGHGGIAFGHYVTPGKRSPHIPPGIYEGEFNRKVADLVAFRRNCVITAPGPLNPRLRDRVKFVNDLPFPSDEMALISIHANASGRAGGDWTSATGPRVFISRNASLRSETLARLIHAGIESEGKLPFPPRPIAKRNFSMVRGPRCPAVLVECGFMTNETEATFLASDIGPWAWAGIIRHAMAQYEAMEHGE